jgi:ABC transporter substrate binding protein
MQSKTRTAITLIFVPVEEAQIILPSVSRFRHRCLPGPISKPDPIRDFDAAYVEPGPLLDANLTRIAGLAMQHRVPTFGNYPHYAENGLLLAYGGDADPLNERAADYVDKILRGAKPSTSAQ